MRTRRQLVLCITACGMLAISFAAGGAQMPAGVPGASAPSSDTRVNSRGQTIPPPITASPVDQEAIDPRLQHEQAKMRNVDRQNQLVADTQKLLQLANELQTDVQKSNKDTLSLDVIRKADEIEKLAKSVRDKMKGS
jgi:hypothetical protein